MTQWTDLSDISLAAGIKSAISTKVITACAEL
jgi:hypothetical protein